jgi:purine-cytosine permease-like protein
MPEEILLAPEDVISDLILKLGSLGKWLQALGLIVILWIIIQIANWLINRKRLKMIDKIKNDMNRIEEKIDKISKQTK